MGGVFDAGENIVALKQWAIGKALIDRGSGGQELKDIGDAEPEAADARAAAAPAFFDRDPAPAAGHFP